MQEFFRQWYQVDPHINADAAFVNQNDVEIMTRLNAELRERLDDKALRARFRKNVQLIRDLMFEISERVRQFQPQIQSDIPDQPPTEYRLGTVFETLNL